uniref:flavocytochrome c n=1 Tax=Anaerococcus mediterraneensis TaxID=1870984 RepID=UPI0009315A11|nr:flavocytochrome c [Anaerococcus mediterraneensis]
MKKYKSLAMALAMAMALSACGNTATNTKDQPKEEVKQEEKSEENTKETENTTDLGSLSGEFEGSAKGYGGDINVKVTMENGVITAIDVDQKETGAVGGAGIERIKEEVIAKNTTDLDNISGATISSAAFLSAVKNAIKEVGADPEDLVAKESKDERQTEITTDTVIVGAGGAGLSAAIQMAQDGKKVTIVEKAGITGGNSSLASGGMNAAETKLQKEEGIPDTVETFVADTMKGGHDKNNKELVEKMAAESSEAVDWLEELGAPLKQLKFSGGQTEMRTHAPINDEGKSIPVGNYLVQKLTAKAKELGVNIVYDARCEKILMEDGKAVGVQAAYKDGEKLTVNAGAVIVATGGFGSNQEMVEKYNPDLKGYVSTNAKSIEGDAVGFLEEVGANFIDMDQIQIHPTVVQKDGSLISEGLRGEGAILVNQDGKRFVNELQTRDFVSKEILSQKDPSAWLIVDQSMFDQSATIAKYFDKGLLTKCDDYKALADLIGTDEETIKETIENWIEIVKNNKDTEFGREGMDQTRSDLSVAPYYAVLISPGIHHTMGGVEVNTNSEVLDKDGKPIPGLYAAGEVTGGIHGANRLGGNAVTDIVVFGRNAAKRAEEYISK